MFTVVLVLMITLFTAARMMKSSNLTLGTNIFLFFLSANKDLEFLLQQGGSNKVEKISASDNQHLSFPLCSNIKHASVLFPTNKTYFLFPIFSFLQAQFQLASPVPVELRSPLSLIITIYPPPLTHQGCMKYFLSGIQSFSRRICLTKRRIVNIKNASKKPISQNNSYI